MVIRDHMVDHDRAGMNLLQAFDLGDGRHGLGARRHQGNAIALGPAIILRVGDLDPPRPPGDGPLDESAGARRVGPVNDGIDGERQAGAHHLGRDLSFPGGGAPIVCDAIGDDVVAVLDGQLDMIEARGR